MDLKHDMIVVELGEEYAVVPVGEAARSFHGMIRLNETGKDIWDGLVDGLEEDEIARRLMERYEGVDRETALRGIRRVKAQLRAQGILEEEAEDR